MSMIVLWDARYVMVSCNAAGGIFFMYLVVITTGLVSLQDQRIDVLDTLHGTW